MKKGGNKRLHDFFDQYDLNAHDMKEKYFTKAALFHRE